MQATHCPVCYGELEVRELAPCDDCGAQLQELEHFREGKHTFSIYEVFPDLELTLCDFCAVDFTSYHPEFFGLPKRTRLGFGSGRMKLVRSVDQPVLGLGKVCTQCGLRLTFARFVIQAPEKHARPE